MKKAGELVQGFFETYGIRDEKNYSGFMAAWKDIIGEDLATHSRPVDIRTGTLIIAVDHPGWMTRIRFAEPKTIAGIHKRFPQLEVVNLAFQLVDKLPSPVLAKRAIDQAEQAQLAGDQTNAGKEATISPAESGGTGNQTEQAAPIDRTTLFSALDKLRAAMEKKSSQADSDPK